MFGCLFRAFLLTKFKVSSTLVAEHVRAYCFIVAFAVVCFDFGFCFCFLGLSVRVSIGVIDLLQLSNAVGRSVGLMLALRPDVIVSV